MVGVDDMPLAAAIWPGLTTVAKPKYELGSAAFELLLQRFASYVNDTEPKRVVLTVSLMERGSVAAPFSR